MPRFDVPGRAEPMLLILHGRKGQEMRFAEWPHYTESPEEIEALLAYGAQPVPDPPYESEIEIPEEVSFLD